MTRITAVQADITTLEVDAIVNAADTHLQHGGGVAAAISRAGGPIVQQASDEWVRRHGPLRSGTAAITPAGEMPARVVIHVAGPIYSDGQPNRELLETAVRAALDVAIEAECRSVALPAISAGIYGYPRQEATAVIASACRAWCTTHPDTLDEILLVGFDESSREGFAAALER